MAELQQLFAGQGRGIPATPLRVAASLTIGEVLLPDIVARWKHTHTASPVQIVIANTSEVIRRVADFDVDLGFIEGPQTHPATCVCAHRWPARWCWWRPRRTRWRASAV